MGAPNGGGDGPTTGNLQAQIDQLKALLASGTTGGMQLKGIQRGTILLNTSSVTATITSVDVTKTELRMIGWSSNGPTFGEACPRMTLTNATTITATKFSSSGATTISYEVVEDV